MKLRLAFAVCAAIAVFPPTASAKSGHDILLLANPSIQGPISMLDIATGRLHQIARGWDASWSPNGKEIAFFSGHNLFVADRNGKHRRQLTHDLFPDFDAVWSPDGTRIAFLQQPQPAISLGLPAGSQNDIMIVDVASGVVTHLTHDRTSRTDLVWSPDGAKLFFRTGVMGAFTGADDAATGAPAPGFGRIHSIWSPDGHEIAYVDGTDLNVADADGSNARVVVHTDPCTYLGDASWSPGGRSIVFSESPCDSGARLEIVSLASGSVRPLTEPQTAQAQAGWQRLDGPQPMLDLMASWSPDGKWIAFTHWGRRPNVAVVHPTGGGLRIFAVTARGPLLWEPNGN